MTEKPKKHLGDTEQAWIDQKRQNRMNTIDALPEDVRALVHDYGYNVVRAMLDLGITKPRHIRHLVETVLDEFSPTRGSFSAQGIRVPMMIDKCGGQTNEAPPE